MQEKHIVNSKKALRDKNLLYKIKSEVFIYPTDTIYGIGCDATNGKLVQQVRSLKRRPVQPFSIIAPSKEWIRNNCVLQGKEKWLDKLPGKYTLILNIKNKEAVHPAVNSDANTLGVRIPNHPITEIATQLNTPIVTTSANIHGEPVMKTLEELPKEWESSISTILYDGPLNSSASTIIDLTGDKEKIIKR